MLKIKSTVIPPCRMQNEIKKGGLWYSDAQNELLNDAKECIKPKVKRKDEVKKVCIFFWLLVLVGAVLYLFLK